MAASMRAQLVPLMSHGKPRLLSYHASSSSAAPRTVTPPAAQAGDTLADPEHLLQGPKHLGGERPDGSWITLEPDLADNRFHGNQMLTSSSKSFPGHAIPEPPRRLMAPMPCSQLVPLVSQQGKRPWSYLGSSRRFPNHPTHEPGHPSRRKAQPARS